jgi:hypothetical protein
VRFPSGRRRRREGREVGQAECRLDATDALQRVVEPVAAERLALDRLESLAPSPNALNNRAVSPRLVTGKESGALRARRAASP